MSLSVSRTSHAPFVIAPTNIGEAMEYAKMIASSCFCPAAMRGKPGDIIIAMQMGAEIGLNPLQALQNIAIINGKPCVYGDAALAVVIASPNYLSHREWSEGSIEKGNLTAFCGITRRNSDEYIKYFSMEDAKKAGLWSKAGVWQQYPARMLQMRARAFAMRDKFADALRGINIREEVEDYHISEVKKFPRKIETSKEIIQDKSEIESLFVEFKSALEIAADEESLKKTFTDIKSIDWKDSGFLQELINIKDIKKVTLANKELVSDWDAKTYEVVNETTV